MKSIKRNPADPVRKRGYLGPLIATMLGLAALAILLVSLPAQAHSFGTSALSVNRFPGIERVAQQSSPADKASAAPAGPNDCGLLWRVVPSPNGSTNINRLWGVAAIAANDIWAAGAYSNEVNNHELYQAMAQHWDGTTWSLVTVPQPGSQNELLSISAISSNDIWAVGYYIDISTPTEHAYIAHWDGSNWTQASSPDFGSSTYLQGVAAVAPDAVWAVGGYVNQAGTGALTLALFWDGRAWASVPSPNPGTWNYLESATATTADDMWAVGEIEPDDPHTQYERTLTVHCTRSACVTVTSPNTGVGNNVLQAVSAFSSSDVWAVGSSEVITDPRTTVPLTIHWNGQGWSVLSTPPLPTGADGDEFRSVIGVAANAMWAVGSTYNTTTSVGQTYAAFWNGSSWTAFSPPNTTANDHFLGVAALSINDLWAVGSAAGTNNSQTLIEHYSDPCVTPSPTPTNIPNPGSTSTPSSCSIQFTDVPVGSTFYSYVHCLACRNILGGYSSGCSTGNPCFKPGNPVTRGQLAKIVSNSAGYNDQHTNQSFQDVPVGSTFYLFVERLASRSIIGGYACGGAGEPCVPPANLPYFRPNAQVTRGQTSKIVAIAASLPAPPSGHQTFQDVPVGSTFWQWIESLASAGTIGGYPCGGAGEPCVPPQNRPYFRPGNNVTRGQAAKIVSNTFFPGCQSH